MTTLDMKALAAGLALFCAAVLSCAPAAAGQKIVRVGIWPCTSPMKVYRQYQGLAEFLSGETGLNIKLVVPKNCAAFFEQVEENGVDFALQDANVYARLAGYYNPGYLLQTLTSEGKAVEKGVIIARKDSGIKAVKDLKGKKMIFGDEHSLTKYITIKRLLAENGLDIKKDLGGYSFGGDCEGIILRVYLKRYDAGAIDNWSWKEMNEPGEHEVNADKLAVIAEGPPVPYWVFAAHKNTDIALAARVELALLKLDVKNPAYRGSLKDMEIGGFVKAKAADYVMNKD
ncbi:MAG TPA: hypothetical protein DCS63_01000 [Elusimicrobia bacterium]|nr:hypothetical protein [Elusimicrobiota bacterium]